MHDQPTPPVAQPPLPDPTPLPAPQKRKRWWLLPVILMVWPAILVIVTIVLYAVINFFVDSSTPTSSNGDLFSAQNTFKTITNVILFLCGISSVSLGPISFIAGIVLLVTRSKKRS